MGDPRSDALRRLPSVDATCRDPRVTASSGDLKPEVVVAVVRDRLDDARQHILDGDLMAGDDVTESILTDLRILEGATTRLVINGTGVIIQTNLGRAPVSEATASAMADAARSYLALETDLVTGERGGRGSEIEVMMRALTGAERTLVVNNNAAAVLLMLAATCAGRAVIVSRGEAVEIGGGFRIPNVLRQSGATLVEVGTTNRTYVADYELALTEETAALLRVHASNFAVVGFVSRPSSRELVELAHPHGILALEDVGSGCLLDTAEFGLDHEPTLSESVAAGLDAICASGDKLLGGPQAGLILGRAAVIDRITRHPLARAVRADKTCLAGIEATLRHYLRGDAVDAIPVWWSISRPVGWLEQRARGWAEALGSAAEAIPSTSVIGGGSLPGQSLPSYAVALDSVGGVADVLARRLRLGSPSVYPRIADGRVTIDARSVLPRQDDQLLGALRRALGG